MDAGTVQEKGDLFTSDLPVLQQACLCAKLLGHGTTFTFFGASHLAQAAHHAESTSEWIRLAIPLSPEGRPAQTVISEFASPNVT